MQTVKIIAVSSLAAHKTASLKAQITVLGSALLPVPTIVFNGVASFSIVKKQHIDFMPILEGTMQLCLLQNHKIFLFVGYVTSVEGIYDLIGFINKYKKDIAGIFIDPISGDNDKPYIDKKIIEAWPQLLALADFAFPNQTELKFYSGIALEETSIKIHIEAFETKFPKLHYIITSFTDDTNKYGVMLKNGKKHSIINHPFHNTKIDGTGDVFAAYFLKYHLLHEYNISKSCKKALKDTLHLIAKSVLNNSNEIIIG